MDAAEFGLGGLDQAVPNPVGQRSAVLFRRSLEKPVLLGGDPDLKCGVVRALGPLLCHLTLYCSRRTTKWALLTGSACGNTLSCLGASERRDSSERSPTDGTPQAPQNEAAAVPASRHVGRG